MIGPSSRPPYIEPKIQRPGKAKDVTIGIGVLCSSKITPPWPDTVILLADTMGSTDSASTDEMYKIFVNNDLRLYIACAEDVALAGELVDKIATAFTEEKSRKYGGLQLALWKAANSFKTDRFLLEVLPGFAWDGRIRDEDRPAINKAYRDFRFRCELIVGTFDETGRAWLFSVGQCEGTDSSQLVHNHMGTGYWANGAGAYNADMWLKHRGQQVSLSLERSTYHAFEAKQLAGRAPSVNHRTELVIANAGGEVAHLTDRNPNIKGFPITLTRLAKLVNEYGPQPTEKLDAARTVAYRKEKRRQASAKSAGEGGTA